MSLSIFISNDINELANELCSKVELVNNYAFIPHQIVIQTRGMNQWLKYKIAENTGIAANIQFVTPEEIIYNAFKILGGSYKTKIHRQHIDWLIYRILGYTEFKKLFPIQYAYYAGDGGIDSLKKWEFSNILADLFDQYQIYRTSMIGEWNVIQDIHSLPKDQQWQ
ncbi:MAG TPA: exodeoxyribonuclease V subunit gamma, partial [Saprospiraceae bacterium]|nr:exodeoxyribonuclease V subunit gamma [Saprospiraceae bacterium]